MLKLNVDLKPEPPERGVFEGHWRKDSPLAGQTFEEKFAVGRGGTTICTGLIVAWQVEAHRHDNTSANSALQSMIKDAKVFVLYSDGETGTKKVSDVLDALDAVTADVCYLCNEEEGAENDIPMELIACDLCNRSSHHKCLSDANQTAHTDEALLLCDGCNKCDFIISMRTFLEA